MRKGFKMLVKKPAAKLPFEGHGIDGRRISKQILRNRA
jgi:hypothetical protein